MLLGLVYATSGEISVLGHRVPRHVSRVLPEIGALIEEPAAYPHLSGRANLRLLDAAGPHGARRTRHSRVEEARSRPSRHQGHPRLADRPERFRRDHLPVQPLAPGGIRLCTRIGVLDSGRLVLQDQLAALQKPTGRVQISTDDPERAVATLDGLVESQDGADLVVRSTDPATLNARSRRPACRSLAVQRRSLEEIVLEVTGARLGPVRGAVNCCMRAVQRGAQGDDLGRP